jgi:eukaryotic-like serine/threonine-protein kinase
MDKKPILRPNEQPLPRYAIHRLIGKGGLGEVYFATSDAGKEVALKLFTDGRGVQARGARTILNLSHPNLVHLYDLAIDDKGREWLVMEFVHGESLDRMIARPPRKLSLAEARLYFADMAGAVAYLHDHNVMHRDLKPANLLLPRGAGRLKVVDFDLCRRVEVEPTHTQRIGTEQYMAPEMFTGRYDHRVDIYSAGLILAEMLTGQPVFHDLTRPFSMQHQLDVPDLSAVPSERMRRAIAKALEKDKEKRYASMGEMAAEVDAAFAELLTAPRPPIPVATPVPVAHAHPPSTVPLARAVLPARARHAMTALVGGLLSVPALIALAGGTGWVLLSGTEWTTLLRLLVTATVVSWAALLAGVGVKAGERSRWDRRLLLALCGGGIGALAYWMDGWPTPRLTGTEPPGPAEAYLFGLFRLPVGTFGIELGYVLYFALALIGPRWWRGTATDRETRYALQPPIEAAAWGGVIALVAWPWAAGSPWPAVVALALAASAVQIVSPWVPTVAAQPSRKKRLKPVA